MRLLLVEDDPAVLEVMDDAVGGAIRVTVARCRDEALDALTVEGYDLAVCDLRIPTDRDANDEDASHGLSIVTALRDRYPGLPILVFSAYGTLDIVQMLLDQARQADIYGTNHEEPLLRFFKKSDTLECIQAIRVAARELAELDQVEVSVGGSGLELSHAERRVIQIYGRRIGGTAVRVSGLGGGLSGRRTLRLAVTSSAGAPAAGVFARLGSLSDVADEHRRYSQHLAARLRIGAYTPLVAVIDAGCSDMGGNFYTLAEEYGESLFDRLASDEDAAVKATREVQAISAGLIADAAMVSEEVGVLRSRFVSDAEMADLRGALAGIPWEPVEKQRVQIRGCAQHGDLHGLNVLLDAAGSPVLIDFAAAMLANAAVDPVTLELSLVFHPSMKDMRGDWPSASSAAEWWNLEEYLGGCPFPLFVRACREWALSVAAGDREVLATAYAYAVRQLKYDDTDVEVALAIVGAIAARLKLRG